MAKTEHLDKMLASLFRMSIKGIEENVPGFVSGDWGDVQIEAKEATQGDQPEYRTFTYGTHKWGNLTATIQVGPVVKKIQEWVDKATKMGGAGDALRRDVSLYILARDKSTVLRTYHAKGCYPLSCSPGQQGINSELKTVTLTCKVEYVEAV